MGDIEQRVKGAENEIGRLWEEVRALRERSGYISSDMSDYVRRIMPDLKISGSSFVAPTDHFRTGAITTGYAWLGAPFDGTPGTLDYDHESDYLSANATTASPAKVFLSKAVTNSAAAWQSKGITVRACAGDQYEVGARMDDGTDNNYCEAFMCGLGTGAQRLDYRYRSGGAVATINSGIVISQTEFLTFRLYMYWSGSVYQGVCYPINESGTIVKGLMTNILTWAPAAGRAGLFQTGPFTGGYALWDWFYSTFG